MRLDEEVNAIKASAEPAQSNQDDDDFFASFESNKASKPGGSKMGSLGAKSVSSGMQLKGKAKPAVTKLPANDLLDGWDDF